MTSLRPPHTLRVGWHRCRRCRLPSCVLVGTNQHQPNHPPESVQFDRPDCASAATTAHSKPTELHAKRHIADGQVGSSPALSTQYGRRKRRHARDLKQCQTGQLPARHRRPDKQNQSRLEPGEYRARCDWLRLSTLRRRGQTACLQARTATTATTGLLRAIFSPLNCIRPLSSGCALFNPLGSNGSTFRLLGLDQFGK